MSLNICVFWGRQGGKGGEEKLILIMHILECLSLWPLNIVLKSSFCHFEGISQVNQFPWNWLQIGPLSKERFWQLNRKDLQSFTRD